MSRAATRRAAVEAFFDATAPRYDAFHDVRGIDRQALRARMDTVLRRAGDAPGDVLDAGMGPGRLIELLAERGWRVSGVDVSSEMVALARKRVPDRADELLQAPVEALPFPDGNFDLVVATGVLEYVDDPRAALAELVRILRPAGRVVGSAPNRRSLHALSKRAYYPVARRVRRPKHMPARQNGLGSDDLLGLVASQGLSLIGLEHTSFALVPTPLDRALPGPSEWIARALEHRRPRFERLLATQAVFEARRP